MKEDFNITYKALFRKYYPNLIFYATRLVGEEEAEDVVQDVFVELWKRKDSMEIGDQIQAFLYRAVYTRELKKEIYDAINELPDKCKEVFKLSYLHDMKNREIADTIGVSLRTVEAHMYKALKYLRSRLDHLIILLTLFFLR